ncbi:MAG: hypothetical protein ACTHJL_08595 [Amnibacterium sp.]
MEPVADADLARFAARYRGALDPRDALRWAVEPSAPSSDGSPSPAALLDARRRALYRAPADAAGAADFLAASAAWERELALARAALAATERKPEPGAHPPVAAAHRPLRAALPVLALVAIVAVGIAVLRTPASPPAPPVAAGVPGVLVARASAEAGARSASGLDGAARFLTVVVTCQGDGAVEVRLSDGTDARFACIAAFPRTAVQPSDSPVHRFGYRIRVTGTPDWAMTLSR